MVSISKMFCTKMLNQAAPEIKVTGSLKIYEEKLLQKQHWCFCCSLVPTAHKIMELNINIF